MNYSNTSTNLEEFASLSQLESGNGSLYGYGFGEVLGDSDGYGDGYGYGFGESFGGDGGYPFGYGYGYGDGEDSYSSEYKPGFGEL
jgi:hypothetical protein